MGGIGKTTIATAVYNEISTHFRRCSFLEDVRETLEQHEGIVALQNKLISSITRANSSVSNASEGIRVIKDRVSQHKVLIVLDDVDEKFESEKILGRYENFSAGSRFIITTRNKKLLASIKGCKMYEPEEMSHRHSLQLFSKHAFRTDCPPKDYESLSRQIVLVAAGLPLTLKVVGSLLFAEEKSIWEDTFLQLKEIPPTEVVGRLKLSYNALRYEEQRIFLDIACFFIGENREMASYMWKDCKLYPVSAINVLILRSLIKIGPKNEFKMHDQLRDLGQVIVREENFENPWKRSRVWSHDDALDILERKKGTDSVEALRLAKGDSTYQLTNEQFEKLPELRYLDINGATLTGDFHGLLSNLRWLRLTPLKGGRSPIANFPPMKLVILDLSGSYIPDSWGGWSHIKMAQNLKVLNLYTCGGLTKVPDLSEYKNLEQLNLAKCRGIVDQDLDIGSLENLKVVKLGFTRITRLIGDIGMLRHLEEIDAWGCRNLKEISPDIGESTSLKILRLCSEVKLNLPELPISLKELSVSSPIPNLSSLKELVELRFDNCEEGFEIPGDYLMLSLSKLKSLELYRTNITVSQTTPGAVLPSSLNKLVIDGCPLLDRLPDMENMESLKELKLNGCPQVKEIPGLAKLKSLVSLTIDDGQNLDNMDSLENLVSLTDLVLLRCPVIQSLPTLAHLVNMKTLTFWRCYALTGIRGLNGGSNSLRELDVGECPALQELDGLDSLEQLEHLRLRGLDLLEKLPSVSKMTKLKQLLIRDHPRLRSIEGVECLRSLRALSFEGCSSLERFPNLSSLKSLTLLCFDGCVNLTEVVGLAEMESLRTLSLKGCVKVTQLLVIEKLKSLAELNLPGCTLLEELPDLSGLKNSLRMLNLSGCTKLKEVIGVEKLKSLTVLNLSGCASLERLPDVSGLKGLKMMNTTGCTKLAHGSDA
ncbi:Disease resistance protein L6 [Linum grandiflorum]